jgi:exosome complex RNA-binding protein Csl4
MLGIVVLLTGKVKAGEEDFNLIECKKPKILDQVKAEVIRRTSNYFKEIKFEDVGVVIAHPMSGVIRCRAYYSARIDEYMSVLLDITYYVRRE